MKSLIVIVSFIIYASAYPNFKNDLYSFETTFPGANDSSLSDYYVPEKTYWDSVSNYWCCVKELSNSAIGATPSGVSLFTQDSWANSASTADDLFNTATSLQTNFKALLSKIAANIPGVVVSYGPGDAYAVKSKSSLEEKISRLQNGAPVDTIVKKIDDALRGTIICTKISEMSNLITSIQNEVTKQGSLIYWDNKFSKPGKPSGYVAIHAKLYLKQGDQAILTELQVHLYDIMDGSTDCPKEYTHGIYEITRKLKLDTTLTSAEQGEIEEKGNVAQKLVFLFGLSRANPTNFTLCPASCAQTKRSDEVETYYYYLDGVLFKWDYSEVAEDEIYSFSALTGKFEYFNDTSSDDIYYDIETNGFSVTDQEATDFMNQFTVPDVSSSSMIVIGWICGMLIIVSMLL